MIGINVNCNRRTLKQAYLARNIPYYPFSKPTDKDGTPRTTKLVCPLASFDPKMIRGFSPPLAGTPEASVRIPIALNTTDDTYEWITPTFPELVELHADAVIEQRRFFAICLEGRAQHFVIDLDGNFDKWPHSVDQEDAIDDELRALFPVFYETQFHTVPDMTRWRADKVPAPEGSEAAARIKTSMHINHPGVAFRTQQDMQEFVLRFARWIVNTHPNSILVSKDIARAARKGKFNLRTATPIDAGVFSTNRNMRCSYSRKAAKGKLPLIPMDPNTTLEDALWSSLVCYSMSPDPNDWVGYDTHTECMAISPSARTSATPAADRERIAFVASAESEAMSVGGPGRQRITCIGAAVTADTEGDPLRIEVDYDKGTVAHMPDKIDNVGDECEKDSLAAFNNRVLPIVEPEVLELLVSRLSREKRLLGERNEWMYAIWAMKGANPSEAGRAIAEKWTAGGKPGSSRPTQLAHVWSCGRADRFGLGSIWKWLREDLTAAEYAALRARLHSPQANRDPAPSAVDNATADAFVAACCAAFRTAFTDDEKMRKADELPIRQVMQWWDANLDSAKRKEITLAGVRAVGECVLEYCNLFWTLVKLDTTVVFYKKSKRAPGDDRAFSWQPTPSQAFQGDLNNYFVLEGWTNKTMKTVNVARHWIVWQNRNERNSVSCIPPTARSEVQPLPTCLNTWVGMRISHETAKASAPEGAPNPEWTQFKHYICDGFLALETSQDVKIYFLRWYCSQYVRPGWKLKVACALRSARRQIGKSFLGEIVQQQLLGMDIACETKTELAFGKFNDVLINKIFAIVEEFERCREHNSSIKLAITSNSLPCNPKGKTAYEGPNCLNFYCPTNIPNAFDVDDLAERLFAINVGDGIHTAGFEHLLGYKWDYVQIARGMLDWWRDPANGCVAEDGKTVIWRPEDIPETRGALSQRIAGEESDNPVKAWLRAAVNNEVVGVKWDAWNSNSALYSSFCKHFNNAKDVMLIWTPKKVTSALHDMCPTWSKKKHRIDGQSVQCTRLPAFAATRSEFYRSQKETEPPLPADEDDETNTETVLLVEEDDTDTE